MPLSLPTPTMPLNGNVQHGFIYNPYWLEGQELRHRTQKKKEVARGYRLLAKARANAETRKADAKRRKYAKYYAKKRAERLAALEPKKKKILAKRLATLKPKPKTKKKAAKRTLKPKTKKEVAVGYLIRSMERSGDLVRSVERSDANSRKAEQTRQEERYFKEGDYLNSRLKGDFFSRFIQARVDPNDCNRRAIYIDRISGMEIDMGCTFMEWKEGKMRWGGGPTVLRGPTVTESNR